MGEHTEYNGGPVLSMAIERRTAVAAGLASSWGYLSSLDDGVRQLELDGSRSGDVSDCLAGVIQELLKLGAVLPGANIAIAGSIPGHGDFAALAALTVALVKALSLLAGRKLTPAELIGVGGRAVNRVNELIQRTDLSIVTHGQRGMALLLESATGGMRSLQFPGRAWVMETGMREELNEARPSERRLQCDEVLPYCREWRPGLAHLAQLAPADLEELQWRLPPTLMPRVRHVVLETARTRLATAALALGDCPRLGRLLVEGHQSLREDCRSTTVEADFLVGSAVARGAYGARLSGPAPGGPVVMLVPPQDEARILAQVSQDFQDHFGRVLQAWSTRAAAGVRREAVR
jgi:galactokinase